MAAPVSLRAQSTPLDAHPLIAKVEFRGLPEVDEEALRATLATRETSCRSLAFFPFCKLFPESGTFVEKHYLVREEVPRDELRVRVFLWRRGWRAAAVSSEVIPDGDDVKVRFTVAPGPPTLLAAVAVRQTRPVLSDEEIRDLGLPEVGEPFDLGQVDSTEIRLLDALWARGYGDASVSDTAIVSDSLHTAALELRLEPNYVTTIEAITVAGNEEVSDRTIRNSVALRPGELYRHRDVQRAQRELYRTGMFRQTSVEVPGAQDSSKVVAVTVEEAPFRVLRTGFGFNTIDFFQVEGGFTRYNFLGGGRRLDLNAAVGNLFAHQLNGNFVFSDVAPSDLGGTDSGDFLDPTWQASAELTQPAFRSWRNSLGLGLFTHRRVVPAVVVDRGVGANASFTRRLAENVPLSLGYRYERNTILAGGVYFCVFFGTCDAPTIEGLQGTQSLSPLTLSGFADRSDDPLAPTRGWRARIEAEHASQATLSDFRYNRASAEYSRYFSLGSGTLAARVRGGWAEPLAGTAAAVGVETGAGQGILHPAKRFYAGGSQSVRGYGENQLGPRILTIDPEILLTAGDTAPAACDDLRAGPPTCDFSKVKSSEFQPRPLGGTRLLEGNLEYRQPLFGNFSGAVFVDAARVSDPGLSVPAEARSAVTPGFGVRYASPIGPVRVDLGIKPTLKEDLLVVTQVTDTIDGNAVNRLVRLPVRKEYDPVEGGGFLSAVLNRLTLHLSIGEAF